MLYIVKWKSKPDSKSNLSGQYGPMPKDEAKEWAEKMGEKYPNISYWAEPVTQ